MSCAICQLLQRYFTGDLLQDWLGGLGEVFDGPPRVFLPLS